MIPDRSLAVPHGHVVKTAWVDVWQCKLACRDRMAVGDIKEAHSRLLQQSGYAIWPLPNGRWDGERFVIHDGRHEYLASVMLGYTHILVAWIEKNEKD